MPDYLPTVIQARGFELEYNPRAGKDVYTLRFQGSGGLKFELSGDVLIALAEFLALDVGLCRLRLNVTTIQAGLGEYVCPFCGSRTPAGWCKCKQAISEGGK